MGPVFRGSVFYQVCVRVLVHFLDDAEIVQMWKGLEMFKKCERNVSQESRISVKLYEKYSM